MSADRDLLKDDLEKFQQMRKNDGMDTSIPAIMELVLLSLTGLTATIWMVALYWTPDPIAGEVWMGLGALGMVLFGLPAGAIYVLRRGGAAVIMALIRDFSR